MAVSGGKTDPESFGQLWLYFNHIQGLWKGLETEGERGYKGELTDGDDGKQNEEGVGDVRYRRCDGAHDLAQRLQAAKDANLEQCK